MESRLTLLLDVFVICMKACIGLPELFLGTFNLIKFTFRNLTLEIDSDKKGQGFSLCFFLTLDIFIACH